MTNHLISIYIEFRIFEADHSLESREVNIWGFLWRWRFLESSAKDAIVPLANKFGMTGHVAVRSLLSASDNPWQVEEPKAEGIAAMESNLTERLGVVMENIERDSQDVLDVEVSGTESVLRDLCPVPY